MATNFHTLYPLRSPRSIDSARAQRVWRTKSLDSRNGPYKAHKASFHIDFFELTPKNLRIVTLMSLDILAATTNFYRLAKVPEVKYIVFSSPTNDDQSLLDAELHLRKTNPKVLAVLHSKEFWTFSLNGDEPPIPDSQFALTQSPTKTFEPQNMYKSNSGTPSSLLSLLCATFIKAVKRMLVISLTYKKEVIPFGNAALLPNGEECLQIEPKLVENGDLLVSLTTRAHNLQKMTDLSFTDDEINQTHTIYLAPSGIRAYLTGNTIEESTTPQPSNSASIVDLLETLHSIQIDPDSCNWIKLVPNLSHLNGMTAQVADFFKTVPNSKFLVWPLELCLVQKAEHLRESEVDWSNEFNDPLSLIDSFVKLKTTSTTKTPSNIPTSNNTPADVDHLHHTHHIDTPSNVPTPDHAPIPAVIVEQDIELNSTKEEWDDLDAELFGGDDDGNDPSFDFFDETPKEEPNSLHNGDVAVITDTDLMMLDDDNDEAELQADLASELEMLTAQQEDDEPDTNIDSNTGVYTGITSRPDSKEEELLEEAELENPYDIPLHEMTIPATPPYTDPGAPLPVQSPKTSTRKRSIFSPLNFNPIIKSNVDDKYANGGKFHVPKDVTPSALSDSGAGVTTYDETFGRDSGDDEDSEEDDQGSDSEDENETPQEGQGSDSDSEATQISPSNINITVEPNDSIMEGSMEPELKRLKTGTPVIQSIENVLPESKGSLSPGIAPNGNPNILPFLLRMIPLHTIPSHIYTDVPKLIKLTSDELVNTLLHQIVYDDNCLSDIIPTEESFEQNHSESLQRAIAQVFPDFHETTLSEYSGIPYTKPMKVEVESPLSSFKVPDYSQGHEFITTSPQHKQSTIESIEESRSLFTIPQPKVTVKRLNQEISVNATALHLWNLMGFSSLKSPKELRLMLVHPQELTEQSDYFLNSFVEIYEKANLGHIEKMNSSGKLSNGLLPMDFDADDFEEKLEIEAGAFEPSSTGNDSKRDILIMIPDYDQDLKSTVEIVKLFEVLRKRLTQSNQSHNQVHLKIIPSNFITNNGVYSILSINRLTRLSLSIYNNIGDPDDTFTTLSSLPRSKIRFQLTDKPVAGKIMAEDSFIHLAFERSVDKEWCVAAWSDNKCTFRKVQAWSGATKNKNSLEKIMDEIWDTTSSYASKLPGRKYLVFTRLNGMIADDELLQLKRLSSKSRDLTLVVVSVNHNPRLLLTATETGFPFNKLFNREDTFNGVLAGNKMESVPTVGSSTGMTPSTIFTPQPVNSPDLFTIGRFTSHDSPSESRGSDEASTIVDISDNVHGLIIDYASALANTPARLCVKTGFLIKPVKSSNNKLETFEINLLSCPSTFSSWDLMHNLLRQLRNLSTIGELYGVTGPRDSLVPWHVAAVEKAMRCLVHVRIQES